MLILALKLVPMESIYFGVEIKLKLCHYLGLLDKTSARIRGSQVKLLNMVGRSTLLSCYLNRASHSYSSVSNFGY